MTSTKDEHSKRMQQRAWNRTRLTNIICQERDKNPANGWLLIYHMIGRFDFDEMAQELKAARVHVKDKR